MLVAYLYTHACACTTDAWLFTYAWLLAYLPMLVLPMLGYLLTYLPMLVLPMLG
jgi:hypothetical protein